MPTRPPKTDFEASAFGDPPDGDPNNEPTLRDIYKLLLETRNHLVRLDTAFVRDDLQQPDYSGHRKAHLSMIANSNTLEKFKVDAALKVFGALAILLLGLLGSGIADWVKGVIK